MLVFCTALGALFFFVYLRRVLQHLDPSEVVPDRVRTTLDTLAEGLVVVDRETRIVLANSAFAQMVSAEAESLLGKRVADFEWRYEDEVLPDEELPWMIAMRRQKIVAGQMLQLIDKDNQKRTLRVNASPILGGKGECEGSLVSLDDVTILEERNAALTSMLEKLRGSRDQIRRQNVELQILATQDPLTGALNRRSFFEKFEEKWEEARHNGLLLGCIMVDADHFKSINDAYGHAAGDFVLKEIVNVVDRAKSECDIMCRYGGEEFCILSPGADLTRVTALAERIRSAIASHDFGEAGHITASLGVSSMCFAATTPHEMLNQADTALYVSKRNGRNRLTIWDQVDEVAEPDHSKVERARRQDGDEKEATISFQTVTALLSALAYRDAATAEHSRRVADLCVFIGQGMMSLSDCYLLENAALLHDIGKIGVPDSILLKPGPLTESEWKVIGTHDRISVEIIRSTFACDELTNIVIYHHARYHGNVGPSMPCGKDIPLSARILSIADAYDAMISDRVYRKGMSQEEAFAELRRCAGDQFDPDIVERLIELLSGVRTSVADAELSQVNKRTALMLGIRLENMAKAIDERDMEALAQLAKEVKETASQYDLPKIVELAQVLEDSSQKDDEWLENVKLTIDLMDLCRLTQHAHLSTKEQANVARFSNSAAYEQ
jgi:diguanylate cyclase (GGDEF)-like protein/PAS domain S-box-containing protein